MVYYANDEAGTLKTEHLFLFCLTILVPICDFAIGGDGLEVRHSSTI